MSARDARAPQVAAAVDLEHGLRADLVATLEPGGRSRHLAVAHRGVTRQRGKRILHAKVVAHTQVQVACAQL